MRYRRQFYDFIVTTQEPIMVMGSWTTLTLEEISCSGKNFVEFCSQTDNMFSMQTFTAHILFIFFA